MEDHQIRIITENLPGLIVNTTCSAMLLAKMEQAGVFHREDVQIICAQPTPMEKSKMFYNTVVTRRGAFSILMQSLAETNQTGALQTLLYGGGPSTLSVSPGIFERTGLSINVTAPLPTFTGRQAELKKMHDHLTQDLSKSVNSRRIITITGLGGVGKTQLCRRYIQLHATYYNKNVIWLNAASTQDLSREFLGLAQDHMRLKSVQNHSEVNETVVQEVYNYFRNIQCLFIYDNIEKGSHLRTYLPMSTGLREDWNNIHLILTSRMAMAVWEKQYNAMQLNVLDATEAVEMVRNIIGGIGDDEDSCLRLVKQVQFLPLAIHQSVAYIIEQKLKGSSFGINEYLVEYRNKKELCLSFADSEGCSLEFNDYKETVLTTWQITIDKIMQCNWGDVAIQVLEYIAYFHQHKITTGSLATLFIDGSALKEGIALLIRYSLVSIEDGQDIWSVHRLILEVMRLRLKQSCGEESVLRKLLLTLAGHGKQYVDHITNIFMHSSAYECLMCEFENLQRDISSEIMLKGKATSLNIMCKWSNHSSTSGQIQLSRPGTTACSWIIKFFRLTASLNGKFHHSNWSNVLDNRLDVNNEYWFLAIRSKSACTIRAVEEKCKSDYSGISEPDLLLMLLHLQTGDVIKSLQYFRNVLIELILEDENFDAVLSNLGIVFIRNVYHLPARLLIKSLAYLSKYLLTNAVFLELFNNLNEYDLKGDLEVFGMIGTVLSVLGYHKDGIRVLSRAYQIHKTVCRIDSLHSLLRLADGLRRGGNLLKSRELYNFAHSESLQKCGEGSEFIFEATLGLSELLSDEKQYGEALALLKKLHEKMTCRFELTEEYYVQMVNVLRGKALKNLGRYEESLALLQSIPERFGDRIGWQFLESQSLAKEIQNVKKKVGLRRQKLWDDDV